jgi:hypothetical protein
MWGFVNKWRWSIQNLLESCSRSWFQNINERILLSKLPRGKKRSYVIWVIIYHLTKLTLFLSVKMTDLVNKLAKLNVNEVITLHRVPISIVSDQDPRFTSRLWSSIQHVLGTKLNLNITSHPLNGWSVCKNHSNSWRSLESKCPII